MVIETYNVDDMCRILCISRRTLYNSRLAHPERLPPPMAIPGARRLLWRRSDVESWLTQHLDQRGLAVDRATGDRVRCGRPRTAHPPSEKGRSNQGGV